MRVGGLNQPDSSADPEESLLILDGSFFSPILFGELAPIVQYSYTRIIFHAHTGFIPTFFRTGFTPPFTEIGLRQFLSESRRFMSLVLSVDQFLRCLATRSPRTETLVRHSVSFVVFVSSFEESVFRFHWLLKSA